MADVIGGQMADVIVGGQMGDVIGGGQMGDVIGGQLDLVVNDNAASWFDNFGDDDQGLLPTKEFFIIYDEHYNLTINNFLSSPLHRSQFKVSVAFLKVRNQGRVFVHKQNL